MKNEHKKSRFNHRSISNFETAFNYFIDFSTTLILEQNGNL